MREEPAYRKLTEKIIELEKKCAKNVTAEADLKRNLHFTESLLMAVPIPVFFKDIHGRYQGCNPAFTEMFGFTAEELRGKTVHEIWPSEYADVFHNKDLELIQGKEHQSYEYEIRDKDGVKRSVIFSKNVFCDEDDTVVGLVGGFLDITDRKRAEAIQAAQLRLIKHATDNTTMEFLQSFLDEAEAITESEIGFYHFLEEDQQTLSLQTWSSNTLKGMCTAKGAGLHYPVSQAGVWVDCIRKRSPVVHNDYAALPHKKGLPEGHVPVVRELVVPVFRAEKIVAILGVGNKRTDYDEHDVNVIQQLANLAWETVTHKRAVEALRESEEKFRRLVESSSDWIWEVNANSVYTYASPKVEEMLGYGPEEVVGKTPFDLMLPEEAERVEGIFKELLTRGKPIVGLENVNLHKDARRIVLETNGVPIFDKAGNILGYQGVDRDITDRKRAEERIRRLNETLEQRVTDRTAELENRTRQLQKLSLELSVAEDRERRQIASILHDDFQQELAYIKMELAVLQKITGGEVSQKLARLAELTAECIEKSRDLSYEINPPALHCKGLLAALRVLIQDIKDKHNFEVKLRAQPGAEPALLPLASILYRSARELLINAIKHAGVDSAAMDVRRTNRMIHIRVKDCGNGFDYNRTRSSQGRSAGFGLFNIEDRMAFIGGSMNVKTSPGNGCCVELTAPMEVPLEPPNACPAR
jgi:PAS domain S-box-containing protein